MRFSIQVFIKLYNVKYAVIQCVKVVLKLYVYNIVLP